MWGDWVEKAKAVAQNIDQQINESVGLDVAEGSTPPSVEETTKDDTGGGVGDNVWDDDFDFDDDDDDNNMEAKPVSLKAQTSSPIEEVTKAEEQATDADAEGQPQSSEVSNDESPTDQPDCTVDIGSDGNVGQSLTERELYSHTNTEEAHQSEEKGSPVDSDEQAPSVFALEHPSDQIQSVNDTPTVDRPQAEYQQDSTAEENNQKKDKDDIGLHDEESGWQEDDLIVEDDTEPSDHIDAPAEVPAPTSLIEAQRQQSETMEASNDPIPSKDDGEQAGPILDTSIKIDGAHEVLDDSGGKIDTSNIPPEASWTEDNLDIDDKHLETLEVEDNQHSSHLSDKGQNMSMEVADNVDIATTKEGSAAVDTAEMEEDTTESPKAAEFESSSKLAEIGSNSIEVTGLGRNGTQMNGDTSDALSQDNKRLSEMLSLREQQLASKSQQLAELNELLESQERDLKQKIQETKDEAKKRIQKARERCEAAENRLKQVTSSGNDSSKQKDELIAALRQEGENLAKKQSEMERAVRTAKTEARDLEERLHAEIQTNEDLSTRNQSLSVELKNAKDQLAAARKGESLSGKLEQDLLTVRQESDERKNAILSLEQRISELQSENKELNTEVEKAKKLAAKQANEKQKELDREHSSVLSDLENKLRISERESAVREDALRLEVTELRKRWQDAVRRADALSIDVQSSTAPLLRQLESMERQGRARAAAWGELENSIRKELDVALNQVEALTKENQENKANLHRLERSKKDLTMDCQLAQSAVEEQRTKIADLESRLNRVQQEQEEKEVEYAEMERLANEGVSRVRGEMTQAVLESDERYRSQIEKLKDQLKEEVGKRRLLEEQVEDLMKNAANLVVPSPRELQVEREAEPKELRRGEDQAAILAGALGGFVDDDLTDDDDAHASQSQPDTRGGANSFAAIEELSSKLQMAQVELKALRANLKESEKTKESLLEELSECRQAKEKLPFFEEKVNELSQENREKDLELRGLRDDIVEVRELYRTQLNVLLEEKAAAGPGVGDEIQS